MRINTSNAPAALGPYSQAIKKGNMIFVSGQLGLVPETGVLPEGIEAQTKQSLTNIKNVLAAAGASLEDVVKTSIFTSDLSSFGKINEIYATFFNSEATPARSCVEVSALPKGALVEIECIAIVG
ncbi:MAG: RidA family protein [Paludibacteraceae bacterium]|nr:RidA family protein [Paludibacteraceae bacterium]